MKESEKNLSLENKFYEIEVDGAVKKIAALDKSWVELKKRNFSKYFIHPIPVNGNFKLGEKETWLELISFVIEDLEWLLHQSHHIFWSHMVYSKDAQQLLITFLQEAPPCYLRDEFPKDKQMEEALEKIEYLVFLVFVRLSMKKESKTHFIENLGLLLYDNYIFTVPILLDICSIYGVSNRQLVEKMLCDVICAAPQYLDDFQVIVPHFLHVLSIVKDKFDNSVISLLKEKSESKFTEIRDLILHIYDSAASIQLFLDIYPNGSRLFRQDCFASEVSSFYSHVIPKMYSFVHKINDESFKVKGLQEKINKIRIDLLSIVRSVFCGIVNDLLNDPQRRGDYANQYLTRIMEILHDPLFLGDYNRINPIENDLLTLKDMCQDIDSENFRYISEAIAPFNKHTWQNGRPAPRAEVTGIELESLITEVKDIFPHMGNESIKACLRYYDYNTERVIAAIVENQIPADIDGMGKEAVRDAQQPSTSSLSKMEKIKFKNKETIQFFNDKTELNEIREKFSSLAVVADDDYNDEYDDTYDMLDVLAPGSDDADQERRPFVIPRILQTKEEESECEEEAMEEPPKMGKEDGVCDHFIPNPADLRAKQEEKRRERTRRDYVGKRKGQGQEKQVLLNREFKDSHKAFIGNHNRRKLASRKRNIPLVQS